MHRTTRTPRRRRSVVAAAVAALALAGLAPSLASAASAAPRPGAKQAVTVAPAPCRPVSPGRTASGVPAYTWDSSAFARVSAGVGRDGYVVFNPASGPGAAKDPHFTEQVARATADGTCLLGYVRTDYGRRPTSAVLADVEAYRRWYGITSIFFDESSSDLSALRHYADLSAAVRRRPGALVALNPGTVPADAYADLADLLVVFEGSAAQYETWSPPTWGAHRAQLWHLVHSADPARHTALLLRARSAGAAAVYVTDDVLDNPWDQLTSGWSEQRALLSAR